MYLAVSNLCANSTVNTAGGITGAGRCCFPDGTSRSDSRSPSSLQGELRIPALAEGSPTHTQEMTWEQHCVSLKVTCLLDSNWKMHKIETAANTIQKTNSPGVPAPPTCS